MAALILLIYIWLDHFLNDMVLSMYMMHGHRQFLHRSRNLFYKDECVKLCCRIGICTKYTFGKYHLERTRYVIVSQTLMETEMP